MKKLSTNTIAWLIYATLAAGILLVSLDKITWGEMTNGFVVILGALMAEGFRSAADQKDLPNQNTNDQP